MTLAGGRVIDAPTDRLDFLNSTGAWANTLGADGHAGTADDVTITGLDGVDFWIGGLAEESHAVRRSLGPRPSTSSSRTSWRSCRTATGSIISSAPRA